MCDKDDDLLVLLILACISDKIPSDAKCTPNHPVMERECPLYKILNNTEKIFRVVVTVDKTRGSK